MGLFEFLLLEKLGHGTQSGSCTIHSFKINSQNTSTVLLNVTSYSQCSMTAYFLSLNAREPHLFSTGHDTGSLLDYNSDYDWTCLTAKGLKIILKDRTSHSLRRISVFYLCLNQETSQTTTINTRDPFKSHSIHQF